MEIFFLLLLLQFFLTLFALGCCYVWNSWCSAEAASLWFRGSVWPGVMLTPLWERFEASNWTSLQWQPGETGNGNASVREWWIANQWIIKTPSGMTTWEAALWRAPPALRYSSNPRDWDRDGQRQDMESEQDQYERWLLFCTASSCSARENWAPACDPAEFWKRHVQLGYRQVN